MARQASNPLNDSCAWPLALATATAREQDLLLRAHALAAGLLGHHGGYGRRPLLLPATMDIRRPGPDGPSAQVSVKAGALQSSLHRWVAECHVRIRHARSIPDRCLRRKERS